MASDAMLSIIRPVSRAWLPPSLVQSAMSPAPHSVTVCGVVGGGSLRPPGGDRGPPGQAPVNIARPKERRTRGGELMKDSRALSFNATVDDGSLIRARAPRPWCKVTAEPVTSRQERG